MSATQVHRRTRDTATTIAAALFLMRGASLLGLYELPDWAIAAAMVAFVTAVPAAAWSGYQVRVARLDDEREALLAEKRAAELRAAAAESRVIQLRDAVLDDEADKALWESIPAAKIDEDTCAFGVNVVVLDQRRFPRAG